VDDKQTNVLVQLDQRVSNLEEAADVEPDENKPAVTVPPTSATDFTNIANNLAKERDANSKSYVAEQRLRDFDERLERVEDKQRQMEMQEMARRIP
jgi:hypothetical protein